MANVGNGPATWGLKPRPWSGSVQGFAFDEIQNRLLSANSPIRYQVLYESNNTMNADTPPIKDDVVNVIFKIYGTTIAEPTSVVARWEKIK